MNKWLNQRLRRWTGAEAELTLLAERHNSEQKLRHDFARCFENECRAHKKLADEYIELSRQRAGQDKTIDDLNRELEKSRQDWAAERTARAQAEAKLALAQHYLSDLPAPTPDDIEWEDDDTKTLATFLETSATGKKLAQHLANRLADYERAAVLYRSPADMPALLKRAHGFRDCRGEILRLSAAGPTPANHEQPDFPLPTDLENLRG